MKHHYFLSIVRIAPFSIVSYMQMTLPHLCYVVDQEAEGAVVEPAGGIVSLPGKSLSAKTNSGTNFVLSCVMNNMELEFIPDLSELSTCVMSVIFYF